jgi:hypothetical protein
VTSLGPEGFSVLEVETRFLYPFLYDISNIGEAAEFLAGVKTFKGNQPVWRPRKLKPDEPYRQELLDNVAGFLFPQNRAGGCQSFEVEEAARNSWFRSGIRMSTAKGEVLDSAVVCCKIELFLSPYGAGILSITLKPSATNLKDFNYYGAQLRGRSMPRFSISQPEGKFAGPMADPPGDDAPLSQRLGFTGGGFNLGDLCKFLLEPIAPHPIQGQFSLYSVVRLDHSVGFDSRKTRLELAALLAGLAQIEERLHAGAPSGEINVPNKILNSKHWAAVSFLGAVHLIADQGDIEFDHQRLPNAMDKYFAPYLCAFLQRLTTHRIIHDAQIEVRRKDGTRRMDNLRREMLSFAVCSNFTEVSSREALNRFYDLSREGLRVSASLALAKEAILDFDAAEAADRGEENLATVAAVQAKVEWLEVFFVSFYATELSHLIAESLSFDDAYTAWTVPAWMVVGGLVAMLSLRPWQHLKDGHKAGRKLPSVRTLVLATLVVAVAWFGYGLRGRKAESEKTASHVELPAEHTSAEGRGR